MASKPSKQQLKDGLIHIKYEMDSLYDTWNLCLGKTRLNLSASGPAIVKLIRRNALESFLLHARNLREFLHRTRRKNNCMMAHDYVGRSFETIVDKKMYGKICTLLSHLSFGRADMRDRKDWDWQVDDIGRSILEACNEFLTCNGSAKNRLYDLSA